MWEFRWIRVRHVSKWAIQTSTLQISNSNITTEEVATHTTRQPFETIWDGSFKTKQKCGKWKTLIWLRRLVTFSWSFVELFKRNMNFSLAFHIHLSLSHIWIQHLYVPMTVVVCCNDYQTVIFRKKNLRVNNFSIAVHVAHLFEFLL